LIIYWKLEKKYNKKNVSIISQSVENVVWRKIMLYKCGTCGTDLERLNDDCPTCTAKEEIEKKRIQEEYDARKK